MKNAQELHKEFVRLGGMRHKLKNKMLAILPAIYESGVYKKYAATIIEYAGKFGDIAKTTVIKRLRLERNLKDKPYLKAAIKEVGVHKVALLAKIATSETDEAFADKAVNMSKVAVQALAKELHAQQFESVAIERAPRACKAVPRTARLELDEEATFLLMKLKEKLGKNLSDKEFVKLILRQRVEQEFPQKSFTGDTFDKSDQSSRYIPVARKRQVTEQTKGKCSYPGCNTPGQIMHHPDRYSRTKNHDNLITICKIHHEFAHNNLIENESRARHNWKLKTLDKPQLEADILYRKYRQTTR
ncbi:HNH endonuclease [Candidatus Peregrinibacteria bacterium]|nr:HNH endonuclease [Candidatus Peregrinibacteria bacterium]